MVAVPASGEHLPLRFRFSQERHWDARGGSDHLSGRRVNFGGPRFVRWGTSSFCSRPVFLSG